MLRALVGFGLGGEWASGAALVSETWPAAHRGKALGLMQSFWAIGYALAALVTRAALPGYSEHWRAATRLLLRGSLQMIYSRPPQD